MVMSSMTGPSWSIELTDVVAIVVPSLERPVMM
jgi:hypothetical protein